MLWLKWKRAVQNNTIRELTDWGWVAEVYVFFCDRMLEMLKYGLSTKPGYSLGSFTAAMIKSAPFFSHSKFYGNF